MQRIDFGKAGTIGGLSLAGIYLLYKLWCHLNSGETPDPKKTAAMTKNIDLLSKSNINIAEIKKEEVINTSDSSGTNPNETTSTTSIAGTTQTQPAQPPSSQHLTPATNTNTNSTSHSTTSASSNTHTVASEPSVTQQFAETFVRVTQGLSENGNYSKAILQDQYDREVSRNKKLVKESDQLQKEKNALQDQVTELTKKLKLMQQQFDTQLVEHQTEVNTAVNERKEIQKRLAEAIEKIQTLDAENKTTVEKLQRELTEFKHSAQQEIENYKKRITELESENKTLISKDEINTSVIQKFEKKISTLEEEKQQLENQIISNSKKMTELEQLTQQEVNKMKEYEKTNGVLTQELSEPIEKFDNLTTVYANQLEAEVHKLKGESADTAEALRQAASEREKLEKQNLTLSAELKQKQETIRFHEETISRFKVAEDSTKNEIIKISKENVELKAKLQLLEMMVSEANKHKQTIHPVTTNSSIETQTEELTTVSAKSFKSEDLPICLTFEDFVSTLLKNDKNPTWVERFVHDAAKEVNKSNHRYLRQFLALRARGWLNGSLASMVSGNFSELSRGNHYEKLLAGKAAICGVMPLPSIDKNTIADKKQRPAFEQSIKSASDRADKAYAEKRYIDVVVILSEILLTLEMGSQQAKTIDKKYESYLNEAIASTKGKLDKISELVEKSLKEVFFKSANEFQAQARKTWLASPVVATILIKLIKSNSLSSGVFFDNLSHLVQGRNLQNKQTEQSAASSFQAALISYHQRILKCELMIAGFNTAENKSEWLNEQFEQSPTDLLMVHDLVKPTMVFGTNNANLIHYYLSHPELLVQWIEDYQNDFSNFLMKVINDEKYPDKKRLASCFFMFSMLSDVMTKLDVHSRRLLENIVYDFRSDAITNKVIEERIVEKIVEVEKVVYVSTASNVAPTSDLGIEQPPALSSDSPPPPPPPPVMEVKPLVIIRNSKKVEANPANKPGQGNTVNLLGELARKLETRTANQTLDAINKVDKNPLLEFEKRKQHAMLFQTQAGKLKNAGSRQTTLSAKVKPLITINDLETATLNKIANMLGHSTFSEMQKVEVETFMTYKAPENKNSQSKKQITQPKSSEFITEKRMTTLPRVLTEFLQRHMKLTEALKSEKDEQKINQLKSDFETYQKGIIKLLVPLVKNKQGDEATKLVEVLLVTLTEALDKKLADEALAKQDNGPTMGDLITKNREKLVDEKDETESVDEEWNNVTPVDLEVKTSFGTEKKSDKTESIHATTTSVTTVSVFGQNQNQSVTKNQPVGAASITDKKQNPWGVSLRKTRNDS